MKKILALFLAIITLTTTAGAVDLYVDFEEIDTDTPPTIVDGRTLVPLRAIFEALGATVSWDQSTKTATGVKDGTTIIIQINNTTAYVNGEKKILDVPAQLINNRTMVPARFISESLGCDVTWYQQTQTAAVSYETKGTHIYVTKTGSKYHYSSSCNGGTYYEATLAEAVGRGLEPCEKCVLTNSDHYEQFDDNSYYTESIEISNSVSVNYLLDNNCYYGLGSSLLTFAECNVDGKTELFVSAIDVSQLMVLALKEYFFEPAAPGDFTEGQLNLYWHSSSESNGTITRNYIKYSCEITNTKPDFNTQKSVCVHKYGGKCLTVESILRPYNEYDGDKCYSVDGCRMATVNNCYWVSVKDLFNYFGISKNVSVCEIDNRNGYISFS